MMWKDLAVGEEKTADPWTSVKNRLRRMDRDSPSIIASVNTYLTLWWLRYNGWFGPLVRFADTGHAISFPLAGGRFSAFLYHLGGAGYRGFVQLP